MGTFLDDTAMLVIVAPLYVPLVKDSGVRSDLVWCACTRSPRQIAYMTPPFGYNLFLMRAMAPPEITLKDIYSSIAPFVVVMVLALSLVMLFPQIAMWLPNDDLRKIIRTSNGSQLNQPRRLTMTTNRRSFHQRRRHRSAVPRRWQRPHSPSQKSSGVCRPMREPRWQSM